MYVQTWRKGQTRDNNQMFCITSSHENLESLTYTDNIKQTKNKVKKKSSAKNIQGNILKTKSSHCV